MNPERSPIESDHPMDTLDLAASMSADKPISEPRRGFAKRLAPILRESLEALLIAFVFALFTRTFLFQAFKIPSSSMEENLLIGDHILVNKWIYSPVASEAEAWLLPMREIRRGDVVVFKFPQDPIRDFVKRCVGLPGDRIELVNKRLWVNGVEVDESAYVFHSDPNIYPRSRFTPESHRSRDNFGPLTVPDGEYFCLGDNRDNSNDSRSWGTVPRELVKGRAFMIYWSKPPSSDQLDPATRWQRSFSLVH